MTDQRRERMETRSRDRRRDGRRPDPRRTPLSLDAIVEEAVAILDESGESALTFRTLAQRLRGGVGSVYWYVSGRSELLDRAADRVLGDVVERTTAYAGEGDPIENVRGIALALFDAVAERPWLGAYAMRTTGTQRNGLVLFERIGQQVLRLGLGPRGTFDGVSAVTGYVIGVAADLAQQPPQEVVDGDVTREGYLREVAEAWRANDPEEFPFLHTILDVFVEHDDAEQFRTGLDLLLAGLRLQAEGGERTSRRRRTARPAMLGGRRAGDPRPA